MGSIGYGGGIAAVAAIGTWPLAAVACDQSHRLLLRAAAAAGAGATAAIVIPTEARAALVALVISGLVFIAVSPRGLASAWLCRGDSQPRSQRDWDALNGAFPAATTTQIHATGRAVMVVAAAGLAGVLVAAVCERWLAGRVAGSAVSWITALVLVVAVVAAGAQLLRSDAKPEEWLRHQWHAFVYEGNPTAVDTRFDSVGGGRFDLWRVAVITFHQRPIDGVGAGSFGQPTIGSGDLPLSRGRRTASRSSCLPTLGIAGGLLLVAGVGLPLAAAVVVRTSEDAGAEHMMAAGLAAGITYFCVHTSLDWVWHMTAVGLPAMVLSRRRARGLSRRPRIVSGEGSSRRS